MANLTITVPDAVLPRVVDAMCADGGFVGGTVAERREFARQRVAQYVKLVVRQYEAGVARDAAGAAADAAANTDIAIT